MIDELIENLKGRIALDEQYTGNPEQADWKNENGVLLSRNEAKQCLAALEGRAVFTPARIVGRNLSLA